MDTGVAAGAAKGTIATVGSSFANVGGSLVGVGKATTAFALFHPATMAAVGGFVVGAGAYRVLGKKFGKKQEPVEVEPAVA